MIMKTFYLIISKKQNKTTRLISSYLLRHRQAEWANQSDAQARIDRYAMATHRAGSADGRLPNRHRLVPPRLARVKSESGFGTRSEPDLRPPTLDDDCRW